MPHFVSLLIATLILCHAEFALAIEDDSESSQVLLGWSDDGRTYAVIFSSYGGEYSDPTIIKIYRDGKHVYTVCNRKVSEGDDDEYGLGPDNKDNGCKSGKKVLAISRANTDKHRGIQRINIETHKRLKRFKLKRVSKTWRTSFNEKFKLKATAFAEVPNVGRSCASAYSMTRLLDGKVIKEGKAGKLGGCHAAKGGYLSANGKYVLLKTWTMYIPYPEMGGEADDDTFFIFIKL